MDIKYMICIEEAKYLLADYLKIKGYVLADNFTSGDEGSCSKVTYDEEYECFIAFDSISVKLEDK